MQKSGYLYKRGNQASAWQQRYVTLNIESGTMKFFAEKSGNRVQKGSVCIKQGKFSLLNNADTAHPFAFEIRMDELIDKSEEAVQILSAENQQQLDQWTEWITMTFKTERRSSAITGAESGNTPVRTKSFLASLFPSVDQPAAPPAAAAQEPETAVATASTVPARSADPPAPAAPAASAASSVDLSAASGFDRPPKPLARRPSKPSIKEILDTETDDGPTLDMGSLYHQDSGVVFMDPNVMDSPIPTVPTAASAAAAAEGETSSSVNNALAEKLEAKLNARRQSFKPPNFKNLLNSNGIDNQPRRSLLTAAGAGAVSEANSDTDTNSPSVANTTPRNVNGEHGAHGPAAAFLQDSARSTANPSPVTEPIRLETPEPSPTVVANADGLAPRRSFSKSPARRRTSKKATHGATAEGIAAQDDSSRSFTPSPAPPGHALGGGQAPVTHPLTRHLKISVRPTEPVRSGHLLKYDASHAHDNTSVGHDPWIAQYITLDITTGMMLVFAEINEKRYQRAKFDVNNCSIKTIDQIFHSRLHCFKISYRIEDGPEKDKKVTAVFAAEDEETLNYWLISFEDCEVYFHTHGGVHKPEKKEAEKVLRSKPGASNSNKPPAAAAAAPAAAPGATITGALAGIGNVSAADLLGALRKRGKSVDVDDEPAAAAVAEEPAHSASLHPFAAQLHSKFASAPAVAKSQEQPAGARGHSSLADATPYGSNEGLVGDTQLLRVNTMNMDQMFAPGTPHHNQAPVNAFGNAPTAHTSSSTSVSGHAAGSPRSQTTFDFSKVSLALQRVRYPSERLARRIKIWYLSSGFSLSSASEVETFVKELHNTGDKVLAEFAEEKFDELQDWANLLAVLRKYEQRRLLEAPNKVASRPQGIAFDVTAKVPGEANAKNFEMQIDNTTVAQDLTSQLATVLHAPHREVEAVLPKLVMSRECNLLGKGLNLLSDDLTFAEDLILYQEEVIDHVWADFVKQRGLLEEREDTISKLHARLSVLEEGAKRGPVNSISHPTAVNANWQEEKNQLERAHNEAKVKLITEIQTLRKVLTPTAEQQFNDLKRSEYLRAALEEEVVNTHMEKDNLKAELAALKDKLQEADNEKAAIEAHWQERLKEMQSEHLKALAAMKGEVKKAQQAARQSADEAANARRQALKVPLSPSPVAVEAPAAAATGPTPAAPAPPTSAVEPAKSLTIVSRYASPKHTTGHANKTYVNHYATYEEPEAAAASAAHKPVPARADSGHSYSAYNYSVEIKEEAPPPPRPSTVPPNISSYSVEAMQQRANTPSGSGSVSSLRRDELVEPVDDLEGSPSSAHDQHRSNGHSNASQQWNKAQNVVNASIRMMRLPASAANASTPGIPFSTAPPTAANPLQVPRSQLKTNPIRAALKTEVQGGKPPGSSGKTPGAYMAPHSTPYQVMSAATEEGQRSRGVPPVSVSPVPMQGYLSATKATARQQQLIRESARETFAKTYTYQKKV